MNLVLFDIGNTALKTAVYSRGRVSGFSSCLYSQIKPAALAASLRKLAYDVSAEAAVACCVSPENGAVVRKAWKRATPKSPFVYIKHQMKLPLKLEYPDPSTIGTDRLAAASASFGIVRDEHMVISVGTAVTCDCISAEGRFLGGAIGPGPDLLPDVLATRTGLLPRIDPAGAVPSIGRSTEGAIRIGVRIGFAGMLNAIVDHLLQGAFHGRNVPVILTGGYAEMASKVLIRKGRIIKHLVLKGLPLIYAMNVSRNPEASNY